MVNRAVGWLDKALSTHVAPSAYLIPLHSLTFGVSFMFFSASDSVRNSILYQVGPPFGASIWGMGVTIGVLAFMIGLWARNRALTYMTSLFLFTIWFGAAIEYFRQDHWFQLSLAAIQILTYVYFFFANWADRLWDYAPTRNT